jgi:hypothetical protein
MIIHYTRTPLYAISDQLILNMQYSKNKHHNAQIN